MLADSNFSEIWSVTCRLQSSSNQPMLKSESVFSAKCSFSTRLIILTHFPQIALSLSPCHCVKYPIITTIDNERIVRRGTYEGARFILSINVKTFWKTKAYVTRWMSYFPFKPLLTTWHSFRNTGSEKTNKHRFACLPWHSMFNSMTCLKCLI